MNRTLFILILNASFGGCFSLGTNNFNYKLSTLEGNEWVVLQDVVTNIRGCAVLCSQIYDSCSSSQCSDICYGFSSNSTSCLLYGLAPQQSPQNTKRRFPMKLYVTTRGKQKWANLLQVDRSSTTISIGVSEKTNDPFPKINHQKSPFGSRCTKDEDCNYDNGHCLSRKCTCVIGYSFDFKQSKCVEKCGEYGTNFTKYKWSGIAEYNTVEYRVQSGAECMEKCLAERGFVCKNCEFAKSLFGAGHCNLCDRTWIDVEEARRQKGNTPRYSLYYRHCKYR